MGFQTFWKGSHTAAGAEASRQRYQAARDKLKHTFGNLTLLSHSLNATVSNGGFETKKAEIMDNSALELNRYFNEIAHWNEDAIRERGARLFVFVRDIWPHPVNDPIG